MKIKMNWKTSEEEGVATFRMEPCEQEATFQMDRRTLSQISAPPGSIEKAHRSIKRDLALLVVRQIVGCEIERLRELHYVVRQAMFLAPEGSDVMKKLAHIASELGQVVEGMERPQVVDANGKDVIDYETEV